MSQMHQGKSAFVWYFSLLALANLIWAGQGTAVKFLNRHLGPIAITFVPFYIATLILIPVLLRNRKRKALTWSDWRRFIIAGVCGQVLAQLGMTMGISKSLASNAAILNLLIPVITAVLASFMLGEKMTRLRWMALGLGLIGVFLLSIEDLRQSSFLEAKYLVGNLLICSGCLGSSFYNVYSKGLLRRFEEIEILIFSYIAACAASVPLLTWVEPVRPAAFAAFDWKSWAAFGFLAVFMYGVSMLLFFHVLKHIDVTVASASLYLLPVFGVLLAAFLLGERLSPVALCGAAVVLVSTVMIMKYDTASQ
ncbi:MAG TPA: DMT family transporter [Bryobacteraceae bacterium]|nr:DMT family transporter [Bryobacteraceae bacterium]HPU70969.1 DMT family transporter [Bryobacteraceae bacterium]